MTDFVENVVCARPNGCGWSWELRAVRRHWWSRPELTWHGPVFEDGSCVAARLQSNEEFLGNYGDCLRHLQYPDGTVVW